MLIDSNILIYSLNSSSPQHIASQNYISSQSELIFAHQNIFETLRIITHTKFPNPFSHTQAIKAIEAITNQAEIIIPTLETAEIAYRLIEKYHISGAEVFDTYLVATALSNNITTIASDNSKHLKKYQEIHLTNPFSD